MVPKEKISSKTRPNKMNTGLLARLFEEYNEMQIGNKEYFPVKTRDASDHYIGTLSPELQKLWMVREKHCQRADELIQNIIDLLGCFQEDIEEYDDVPKWILGDYSSKFKDLLSELRPTYKKFRASERVFFSLIELEFERPAGMPYFAIRSGFKVHCRKDNTRNDKYNPLSLLTSKLGIDSMLQSNSQVIAIELPKGTDVSKLSPKEILQAILKSMD
jgi:hypothetical protein